MYFKRELFAGVVLFILLCLADGTAKAASAVGNDCQIAATTGIKSVPAKCHEIIVAENPQRSNGRQVTLSVAVIPALTKKQTDNPFTIINGGPGASSISFYPLNESYFHKILQQRDILLVDQRGTGQSNPLSCVKLQQYSDGMHDEVFENLAEYSADCLRELDADTRYYTTSVAVRDLDAVRRYLNYKQLNIYGISYGTRVALHYLKRYPEHVRSVVLDGIVPPDVVLGPNSVMHAQQALTMLFQRCQQDAACAKAYPDLRIEFQQLRNKLQKQPAKVIAHGVGNKKLTESQFTEMELLGLVRMMIYRPETIAVLPQLLHQANNLDHWLPLKSLFDDIAQQMSDELMLGMHNAVVCTEDMPYYALQAINKEDLNSSFLGARFVEALERICEPWPSGLLDEDFHQPIKSDRPVLLLSGQYDPVTPPEYGDRVLSGLSNATHLILNGQAHGTYSSHCISGLITEFVEEADPTTLDTRCTDKLAAEPFFISSFGPEP